MADGDTNTDQTLQGNNNNDQNQRRVSTDTADTRTTEILEPMPATTDDITREVAGQREINRIKGKTVDPFHKLVKVNDAITEERERLGKLSFKGPFAYRKLNKLKRQKANYEKDIQRRDEALHNPEFPNIEAYNAYEQKRLEQLDNAPEVNLDAPDQERDNTRETNLENPALETFLARRNRGQDANREIIDADRNMQRAPEPEMRFRRMTENPRFRRKKRHGANPANRTGTDSFLANRNRGHDTNRAIVLGDQEPGQTRNKRKKRKSKPR